MIRMESVGSDYFIRGRVSGWFSLILVLYAIHRELDHCISLGSPEIYLCFGYYTVLPFICGVT